MKEVPNKTVADKVTFMTRRKAREMGANFGQEYMMLHEFFQNMDRLQFLTEISDAIEERLAEFKETL